MTFIWTQKPGTLIRVPGFEWGRLYANVVEVTGFEPATFWSRTKRATKLRYTSVEPIRRLELLTCGLRNRCSTS